MVPRFYQKNIVEGKSILALSIVFAIAVRVLYFFLSSEKPILEASDSYFWNLISPLFSNTLCSLIGSILSITAISLTSAYINSKHLYIRTRTLLPASIPIFLFSCHPSFLFMNQFYIVAILFMAAMATLFGSYQSTSPQKASANVGFLIGIASLFCPSVLIYIPVLWIGLGLMWCFNFKSFLAFPIGLMLVYIPVFTIFFYTENKDALLLPFQDLNTTTLSNIPILGFNIWSFLILAFAVLILIITFTNYYLNSYKDKIRIRAYIRFTAIVCIFSILASLLLNIDNTSFIYLSISSGSLLLAHHFALADSKGTFILFYSSFILFGSICFLNYLM